MSWRREEEGSGVSGARRKRERRRSRSSCSYMQPLGLESFFAFRFCFYLYFSFVSRRLERFVPWEVFFVFVGGGGRFGAAVCFGTVGEPFSPRRRGSGVEFRGGGMGYQTMPLSRCLSALFCLTRLWERPKSGPDS